MSFKAQIGDFNKKTMGAIDRIWRASLLQVFTQTIQRTPVDEGRARNNWFTDGKGVNRGSITNRPGPKGAAAIRRAQENTPRVGGKVRFYNNLPYAPLLEFGGYPNPPKRGSRIKGGGYEIKTIGGYSRQAPQGMLRISAKQWPGYVEQLRKKNKV